MQAEEAYPALRFVATIIVITILLNVQLVGRLNFKLTWLELNVL